MRIWITLALLLSMASCGADEVEQRRPAAVAEGARGVSVELAAGWQAAPASLTPNLTDPREVLAVGTYPLRFRETACAHMPGSALEDLGPTDALVTVQERGVDPGSSWSDFPARPAHFGPELGAASEASACAPGTRFTDHWFRFSQGDRHFHVLVAFGPQASPAVQAQAWATLDRLRIDPAMTPDWRSSG
ncbi:hypothetical protein [Solirubrobacter soli]|uniref:hypothetical protein n=1 Tax=Solirubrobacter soli TaxID=363832 RepID=UPI0004064FC3|nr:hypothetical protein [Solirubrobacter soli]